MFKSKILKAAALLPAVLVFLSSHFGSAESRDILSDDSFF
jgi:hypothetical protein